MSERNEEQKYNDDVRDMAASISEWAKENGYPDRGRVLEYIHESINGCARVLYTWKAKMCMVYSNNDDAYCTPFGAKIAADEATVSSGRS